MPRKEKVVATKKKGKGDDDGDGAASSITAKLIMKKQAAAAGAKDPKAAAPVKGAKPVKGPPAALPKIASRPSKGKKGYTQVMDALDEAAPSDTDLDHEKEIAARKALRMDDGEQALADMKDSSKAEKKRADKIARQLHEKYDSLLHEEAVITSASSSTKEKEDEDAGITAERDCLRIEPFSLSFRGNGLFQDTSLTLATGQRYGLVGPNGCGKSTFLRNLAAKRLPGMDPNFDLLHVEQEVDGGDETALASVLSADVVREALLKEKEELENAQDGEEDDTEEVAAAKRARLEAVYSELRAISAESAPARAAKILSGLQFTSEMQVQATKEFSGGWRMRIALARALFRQPSLLLLDEPTNHLDLHAVIWLEEYLRRWKKTLIVVSHDRDFLNSIVTRIIHIDMLKLNMYRGDYDSFMGTLADKRRAQKKAHKQQQQKLDDFKKLMSGDAKAGGKSKKGANKQLTAQQRKGKERDIEKIKENLVEDVEEYSVAFEFPDPTHELEYPVIQVNDVTFRYPKSEEDKEGQGKMIFTELNLAIDMESRISLVGHNGAGKSTLLGLIFGSLRATEGTISINPHLRIGYFTQHFADQLEMEISPVQHLAKKFPEAPYQELRKALGKFGLPGKIHTRPIQTLSGGQKNRVVFAGIALQNPDILYLDEPTNHLDIESIEALASALEDFGGGVVVVSHDARLINAICNDIWSVGNNRVLTNFEGSIFDYRQTIIDTLTEDDFE